MTRVAVMTLVAVRHVVTIRRFEFWFVRFVH